MPGQQIRGGCHEERRELLGQGKSCWNKERVLGLGKMSLGGSGRCGYKGKFSNQCIIMIDLIKAATLTNDPEVQKQAENRLIQHRTEQPEDFFLQSAQLLSSKDTPTPIRQAAGTLLAVSLKTKAADNYIWYLLSAPTRSAFKEMVLNTMIDREKLIRRAAANIVAAICCIEVPRNQWPGIAEKITHNISSEDLTVKEVSILTIGFICEQLKDFEFYFEEPLQETILTGILMGIKDSHPEIAETAFKALRDGLSSMTGIMKNSQYREYLISQIIEAITAKNFLEYCLQALIEFVRCYYVLLQPQYVDVIAKHILPIMQNTTDENPCVMSMQFWSTLAKEEKNIESNPQLVRFITGQLGDGVVQALLQNLCFIEDDEEEANGISEGAAGALQSIFQGDSTQYEAKILTFTSSTIHHDNWKYRQASIRAFATLLIGLPPQRSEALVNTSLLQLVSLLNDSVQYVKFSAIRSLSLITEQVPQVILSHVKFLEILEFIVKMGENDTFLKHVCKIVDNLTVPEESAKIIGPHSGEMIKIFLKICLEPGRSVPSISSCLNVIINLIKCSQNTHLCNEYIEYVLTTYNKVHGLEQEKRDLFYSGFFTMAQVCLMTIRKAGGSITMQQLSSLYNLVVEHYKRINDVEGDGFYIVSALAYFIPNDRRLIDDFWKYIEHGLKKLNQEEIFKSTISCICDFATTYREQISDKVDPIVNQILQLYEKNMITRELKLDVLMCIGELFLQCGDFCVKHLKRVTDLILMSCEGVLAIPDLNYAEILQESIIQTLMCIFHGISDDSFKKELPQFLPYVVEFIKLTTEKNRHPKLDYVKESLMLLADVSNIYPESKAMLSNAEFIADRAAILMKFNKDGHLSQAISYLRQQFQLQI